MFKTSCILNWKPPSDDGGSPIIGYHIERATIKAGKVIRWVRITRDIVMDTTLKVNDLVEDNEFQFRVFAENKAGQGNPSGPSETILAKDPWSKEIYFYFTVTKLFCKANSSKRALGVKHWSTL